MGQPVLLLFLLVLLLYSVGIFCSALIHRSLLPLFALSGALALLFLNIYFGHTIYFIIGTLLLIIISSFLNEFNLAKKQNGSI